jgi:hypothetical protein
MSFAKLASVSALAVAALAGCGAVAVKPAGNGRSGSSGGSRASVGAAAAPVSPAAAHTGCLRADHLQVRQLGISDLLIDPSVRVHFAPTPGGALADQIEGRAQGAEVIGAALLYPGAAPDAELTVIENCLASGVSG